MSMQAVPFASIEDLGHLKIQRQWKEIMRRAIESGKSLLVSSWMSDLFPKNMFLVRCITSFYLIHFVDY